MKSLMLKLLIIGISSSFIFANTTEDKIVNFLSKSVQATKSYKIKDIRLAGSQDIEAIPGWKVYFVKIDLDLIGKNKSITITDKIFSNGKVVSRDFLNIDNAKSMKADFVPNFDEKYYNTSNIIAGNVDATNKLAIFSDPLCPFCMSFMPDIINFVNKYPKQYVLYYYHFPLNIHPQAVTLVKASILAKTKGVKNVDIKVYEEAFDFKKEDDVAVLAAFNKLMKTDFTIEDINQKDVIKHLEDDMKIVNDLGLNGTPRLFTNGKIDSQRTIYKNLLKK